MRYVCSLLVLIPAAAWAQSPTVYTPRPRPPQVPIPNPPPVGPDASPHARRAARDSAAARLGGGEVATRFVEHFGDAGVRVASACSADVGRRLAEWWDGGAMKRLPRPGDFLAALADSRPHSDEIALWAMNNAEAQRLHELDRFEAFLGEPLEVVLSLKNLDQLAGEHRARRLAADAPRPGMSLLDNPDVRRWVAPSAGLAAAIFALLWWRGRRGSGERDDPPPKGGFDLPKIGK